jgi:hypothetical protein
MRQPSSQKAYASNACDYFPSYAGSPKGHDSRLLCHSTQALKCKARVQWGRAVYVPAGENRDEIQFGYYDQSLSAIA